MLEEEEEEEDEEEEEGEINPIAYLECVALFY